MLSCIFPIVRLSWTVRVWIAACGWWRTHSVGTARLCSWGTEGRGPGSLCPRCQVKAGCTLCSSTSNSLRRTRTTCSTRSILHLLQMDIWLEKHGWAQLHIHTAAEAQCDSLQTHIVEFTGKNYWSENMLNNFNKICYNSFLQTVATVETHSATQWRSEATLALKQWRICVRDESNW